MSHDHDPNFDFDAVMRELGAVAGSLPIKSHEAEALRVAAVGLHFIRDTGKLDAYRAFFRDFHTAAEEGIKAKLVCRFGSQEEAAAWLPSASAGQHVSIAGLVYVVAQGERGLMLVRTYLPSDFA